MTNIMSIHEGEDKGRSAKGLRTSPFIFSLSSPVHALKQPFQRMRRLFVGKSEALDAGFDMGNGFINRIRDEEKIEVLRGDGFFLQHFLNMLQQFRVVVFTEDDDREILDLAGLDEGHRLKHFIQGAETARHDHKCVGVLDKQGFPDKEIVEVDVFVEVWIVVLFHRQLDIAAHGPATHVLGTAVSGFHDTGASARHDGEANLGDFRGELARHIIIRMVFLETGRAKHRYTGACEMEGPEAHDKFHHYFDRKLKFLPAGARSFEEFYLMLGIDLTGFFNHGRLIPLKPTGFFVKSNAPDHN